MRKITLFMAAMVALFVAVGCDNKPKEGKVITPGVEGLDTAENDSTIYGKLIDGGMNSMILLTDDGDTLELLRNPDDTLEVVKVASCPTTAMQSSLIAITATASSAPLSTSNP